MTSVLLNLAVLLSCLSVCHTAILINIQALVSRIDDIDVTRGSFSTQISMRATWNQAHAYQLGTLPCASLSFNPDIVVVNEIIAQSSAPPRCTVLANGLLVMDTQQSIIASQPFDLRRYPADEHTLDIFIESRWDSTVVDLNITSFTVGDGALSSSEWLQTGYEAQIDPVEYPLFSEFRTRATLGVSIEREAGVFVTVIALPSLFLTIIAWSAFWLPYDLAVGRLLLSVISLLCLLTIRSSISVNLPQTSYATFVDGGFISCFLQISLSFLWNVAVINLCNHGRRSAARKLNFLGKVVNPGLSGCLLATMFAVMLTKFAPLPVGVATLALVFLLNRKTLHSLIQGGIPTNVTTEPSKQLQSMTIGTSFGNTSTAWVGGMGTERV